MSEVLGGGVVVAVREVPGEGEYLPVACAASSSFNYVNELIGKTDVNAGSYRKKRVRISDVRGNVSGVVEIGGIAGKVSAFHFLQEGIRRSEMDMQFSWEDTNGNIVAISGMFLVASLDLTADISAFGEFDLNVEGTGAITLGEIEPPGEVICDEMKSDWWVLEEGATSISGFGENGESFAGHTLLEVARSGYAGMEIISSGTPGNAQALYTGSTTISFDPLNPGNPDEKVFVIWLEDGS
jgi:predicted secreted protein